jgi:hypothetical protein
MVETQMRKYDVYVMKDGFQIEKGIGDSVMIHADVKAYGTGLQQLHDQCHQLQRCEETYYCP